MSRREPLEDDYRARVQQGLLDVLAKSCQLETWLKMNQRKRPVICGSVSIVGHVCGLAPDHEGHHQCLATGCRGPEGFELTFEWTASSSPRVRSERRLEGAEERSVILDVAREDLGKALQEIAKRYELTVNEVAGLAGRFSRLNR